MSEKQEFKTKKSGTRSQFNYTACYNFLMDFKIYAEEKGKRPVIIYENTRPARYQSIQTTVLQHIGIEMWPIMASCLQLEYYSLYAVDWKRSAKLTNDKHLSTSRLSELCPTASNVVGSNHDAAEAILLGYEFLRTFQLVE
jgi:hypothetical protein